MWKKPSDVAPRRSLALCFLVVWLISPATFAADDEPKSKEPSFDLAILNGHVVDGTGAPWNEADVG
ncbi:MAG: hypothetical protein NXI28_27495, partial [bacterium]|nr:hypothetical protein [bacterium]